jgi:adenosylcobinamide-GDP ribazoletransferase
MKFPPHPFFIALQFLTTIPLYLTQPADGPAMGRSLLYYPLVGAIIGGLLSAFLWAVTSALPSPSTSLVAALVLTVWVLLSGGLHLDGLADSVDALMGGSGDRQKTLDLMKDPTSGPMGVLSLILVLLIKFTALEQIVNAQIWQALLIAPLMGRTALIALFLTTPYIRQNGLGTLISRHLPQSKSIMVILVTLTLITGLAELASLWIIPLTALVFWGLRSLFMQCLGGTTGDTAGALVELSETSVLVVMALV